VKHAASQWRAGNSARATGSELSRPHLCTPLACCCCHLLPPATPQDRQQHAQQATGSKAAAWRGNAMKRAKSRRPYSSLKGQQDSQKGKPSKTCTVACKSSKPCGIPSRRATIALGCVINAPACLILPHFRRNSAAVRDQAEGGQPRGQRAAVRPAVPFCLD